MPADAKSLVAAIQLISVYQELLRTMSSMLALGVPDTLLPSGTETLRKAICTMVLSLNRGAIDYTETLGRLRTAYLSLASFIPYEEANAAMQLQTAFAQGNRASLTEDQIEAVMRRGRQIEQEAMLLAKEFDHFAEDREASELLAEIDAMLAGYAIGASQKPDSMF